jgi:hypothetical protein
MEVYNDEPPQPLGLEHRAEVHDEEKAGRRFTMRRGDRALRQGGGRETTGRRRGGNEEKEGGDDTRRRRRKKKKRRHEEEEEEEEEETKKKRRKIRHDTTTRKRRRKIRHEAEEEDGGTHGQVERSDRQVEHDGWPTTASRGQQPRIQPDHGESNPPAAIRIQDDEPNDGEWGPMMVTPTAP